MSTNLFSDNPQQPPTSSAAPMCPPSSATPALPVWAWIFVVVCVGIPVMTCGGALPVLLAAIAIGACASLSRNVRIPLAVRVVGCVIITGAAYGGMVFLLVMLASLK
jgi:hypothetical protein